MPITIHVPDREYLDEKTNEFFTIKGRDLVLEHSLLSISKWESRWHKSYLSDGPKDQIEVLDYIRCMTITPNVDPATYSNLSKENFEKIQRYINNPMTATTFSSLDNKKGRPNGKKVTNEEIYYWMIAAGVPFECEKWHINRLMTLIRVCGINESPKKKMKAKDIRSQYQALNKARRARTGGKG